jgi:SHS2 domain-containing protein
MNAKYTFYDHTADIRFIARGKSIDECYGAAAIAMFQVMTETSKVKKAIKEEVTVSGTDEKSLLYNWLEKLLVLMNTKGYLVSDVVSLTISGLTLHATVVGDVISKGYETHGEVKAITYNQMEIKKKPYSVQVVLDI